MTGDKCSVWPLDLPCSEELLDFGGAHPQLFCGELMKLCGTCGFVCGEIGVKEVERYGPVGD